MSQPVCNEIKSLLIVKSQNRRIKIFSMLLCELRSEFSRLQQKQQFKLVQLYEIQLQKIREISLRKHLLITKQLQKPVIFLNIKQQKKQLFEIWNKKQQLKKEVKNCLNYFTLTNSLKFGRETVTSDFQVFLQKSLTIVEQIIGVYQLSLFFNIQLRLIKISQNQKFSSFECFLDLFGHQKVDNKCELQTLQIMLNFLISQSKLQPVTENKNFLKKALAIIWKQIMKVLENFNHQAKSMQCYIFKDYFKSKHISIIGFAYNILREELVLEQDFYNGLKLKYKIESNLSEFQNLIRKFESYHTDCIQAKIFYRFYFHQIKLMLHQIMPVYTKSNQLKTLINLTTLFLEKSNQQEKLMPLQNNSQTNDQEYAFENQINFINQSIFFDIVPFIMPRDLMNEFWDLCDNVNVKQSQKMEEISFLLLCSLNMLKQALSNKDERIEQFIVCFKSFIDRIFDGSQSIKTIFDSNNQFYSQINLIQQITSTASDLMTIFEKIFNQAMNQNTQIFNVLFLHILKIKNLIVVQIALVLLNEQPEYFELRLPLKVKILISIAKIFQQAQQEGFSISKYYGQYFYHVKDYHVIDLKIEKSSQNFKYLDYLTLKKLFQCKLILQQSKFSQTLANFALHFLSYQPYLSKYENQRKYSKNALKRLRQKHRHKNIKFLQVCLQKQIPSLQILGSQQNWQERENLIQQEIKTFIQKLIENYNPPAKIDQNHVATYLINSLIRYDQNDDSFKQINLIFSFTNKINSQVKELKEKLYSLSRILIRKQLNKRFKFQDRTKKRSKQNYFNKFAGFITTNFQL